MSEPQQLQQYCSKGTVYARMGRGERMRAAKKERCDAED